MNGSGPSGGLCLIELGCEHWCRKIVEWFRGKEVGGEGGD